MSHIHDIFIEEGKKDRIIEMLADSLAGEYIKFYKSNGHYSASQIIRRCIELIEREDKGQPRYQGEDYNAETY